MDFCAALEPYLTIEKCTPVGLVVPAIAAFIATVVGACVGFLKDWLTGQKPKTLWYLFAVVAIYLILQGLHPALSTPAARLAGAIPIAAFLVLGLVLAMTNFSVPTLKFRPRLDVTAFAAVPLFLFIGGGVGWWFGQVPVLHPAVFLVPDLDIDDTTKEDSSRAYNGIQFGLANSWGNSQMLDIWPRKIDAELAARFQRVNTSEFDRKFSDEGATVPVKYPIRAVVRVPENGLTVQTQPYSYVDAIHNYQPAPWPIEMSRGLKKRARFIGMVAGYRIARELIERACPLPATANSTCTAAKRVSREAAVAKEWSQSFVTELKGELIGPDDQKLKEIIDRAKECSDIICSDGVVRDVSDWLDRELTDDVAVTRITTAAAPK